MKRVKEYDTAMTPEEVVARLKEKTVPFRVKLIGTGDWAFRLNLDGSFGIKKDISSKTKAWGKLWTKNTDQGSHLILEVNSTCMMDLLFAIILSVLLPILVYMTERDHGRGGASIFGGVLAVLAFLGCALWSWHEEKELIEFFEVDILGIPK